MGKKSTKENKNIYQIFREEQNLTRDKASELMEFISPDRIEKIESEKSLPHPDEILVMADAYKMPELCNYFCSHECPIGQKYIPEVKAKDLSQIVLELLSGLNAISKEKDRMVDISVDGEITEDEYEDFKRIRNQLNSISMCARALQLWLDPTIAAGKLGADILE